jgi:hypothetical protein
MKAADPTGLSAQFRLAVTLPAAIPVAIGLALAASGAPRASPSLQTLLDILRGLKTTEIAAAILFVVIICTLVAPFQLSLVRLLEGYWGDGRLARKLTGLAKRFQMRRLLKLRAAAELRLENPNTEPSAEDIARMARAAELLRQRYPAETDILPTSLGNALRAAERRAGDRYGLDAIVLWPRLYLIIPSKTKAAVSAARGELDLAAGLTVSLALSALVALVFTARHGWWLALPSALLLSSCIAYRGAVANAIRYGAMIAAAFDLHRFALLTALHLPLPADGASERGLYEPLQQVLRGIPDGTTGKLPSLLYLHLKPAESPEAAIRTQRETAKHEKGDGHPETDSEEDGDTESPDH